MKSENIFSKKYMNEPCSRDVSKLTSIRREPARDCRNIDKT